MEGESFAPPPSSPRRYRRWDTQFSLQTQAHQPGCEFFLLGRIARFPLSSPTPSTIRHRAATLRPRWLPTSPCPCNSSQRRPHSTPYTTPSHSRPRPSTLRPVPPTTPRRLLLEPLCYPISRRTPDSFGLQSPPSTSPQCCDLRIRRRGQRSRRP